MPTDLLYLNADRHSVLMQTDTLSLLKQTDQLCLNADRPTLS